jgi:hypothetical protein
VRSVVAACVFASVFVPSAGRAQSAINLAALRGLAPFATLLNSPAGLAALASNFSITAAIQMGTAAQPSLEPFAAQQRQALADAFITSANALELADGLGTKLDAAYRTLATCASTDDGVTSQCTLTLPALAGLIGYTSAETGADSGSGKYFFANETVVSKSGATPVSAEAAAILAANGGTTDVYGKAYHHPAGSAGSDPAGDARPFQTEPKLVTYSDPDYFGVTDTNEAYLSGPIQDLTGSPAFPSGHTTFGYTESLLLAILVPERYPQMVVRAAEYGHSRIVLGAHYPMDVIAGRTLASYDLAHLLAGDPVYEGQQFGKFTIADYPSAVAAARSDLRAALATACGGAIAACARDDASRFADPAVDAAFYESTQTYGLPVVYPATAGAVEDVAKVAPEAGHLLTAAFPALTLEHADRILTETEGPGGGFLDNGSAFGLYSRLDLYKASLRAASIRQP